MITDAEIVNVILAHEGGTFTDDPLDRGGPKKWGITIPVLQQYRPEATVTAEMIGDLTRAEAGTIYTKKFITPFKSLPDPLRVNVIDMSVNAGIRRGVMLLQQTVGAVVDGNLGGETAGKVKARDWNPIYVGVRLAFYERLIESRPSQIKWRNGWRARAISFWEAPKHLKRTQRPSELPIFGFMGKAA